MLSKHVILFKKKTIVRFFGGKVTLEWFDYHQIFLDST